MAEEITHIFIARPGSTNRKSQRNHNKEKATGQFLLNTEF